MGEVYRARDVKLNRDVALKILPEAFAADPDRLARFHREAQLLATLNHPHIAAIYGLEEAGSVRALVLELVDGPTLADRLAQGPLPIDDALITAQEITAALEAAHERGVIHRDLKPANIKIASGGAVKVLDFGLAKMLDSAASSASDPNRPLSMSPTLSVHATYAGVILGTAAYMSPEQARGRTVDKRADVWAFGCVLFEMLAGARPFDGEDLAETIGAVIHKQPAWDRLPASTPAAVRTTLERCLQKDPKQRIRDIGDVQLALGGAFDPPGRPTTAATVALPPSRARFASALGAAAALAIGAAGIWTWIFLRSAAPNPQPVRFSLATPAPLEFNIQGYFRNVAVSDDGRYIVYIAGSDSQLMLRPLDQPDATSFPGITGASFPFLSPDGGWVGYFNVSGSGAELKKVSITGGPSIVLCRFQGTPRGATWSRDDTIVFATNDPNTGLLSVAAAGGDPKVLTMRDSAHGELDHLFPAILPDGRHVLYTIAAAGGPDAAQIAVLDLQTNERRTLIRGGTDAQYVDTGHLVYAAAGSLRAVRFAPGRLALLGDAIPILDHVATMQTGAADYRISRGGTLVYVSGGLAPGVTRTAVWMTREGREDPLPVPPRSYTLPRLSPDETQIAFDIRDQQSDIWIWHVARRTLTPLTFDPSVDGYPVWTGDGHTILFVSGRNGPPNVYSLAANGTGAPVRLVQSVNPQNPMSLSPDGTRLVVTEVAARTGPDLMLLHLDTRKVEPLLQTAFAENGGEISPDGRWLAYYSNESGSAEVYVRPFPNVNEGRWLVSRGGGTRPAWSKDGKELFYLSPAPATAMMAVPVQTSPTFSAGNATKLFDGPWYAIINGRTYDVSRDGKRFLMIKDSVGAGEKAAPPTINVVLNWTEELKMRLPASR